MKDSIMVYLSRETETTGKCRVFLPKPQKSNLYTSTFLNCFMKFTALNISYLKIFNSTFVHFLTVWPMKP